MEVLLTDGNFETEVYEAGMPVLVDFYADWCNPCRAMAPVVEALAGEYDGKVKVGKLNVDDSQEIAGRYGIMSIPTFIVFKGRNISSKLVGMQDKKTLAGAMEAAL